MSCVGTLVWLLVGMASGFGFMYYYQLRVKQAKIICEFQPKPETTPRAAFTTSRLTPSTFVVREYNDIYDEHPQIFVKLSPSTGTMLIIDTGCGGATADTEVGITSLRQYIEEVRLECNGGEALNEGKRLKYVVVATHCHYDHILGMEQFNDSPILMSSHSPSFVSPTNLPTHSLCKNMGIPTPKFKPLLVPHQYDIRSETGIPLGVFILHTPGHTPDELAIYDAAEKMLYVGDSLYETETIIFPKEGSIGEWMASIDYLISFVKTEEEDEAEQVRMSCGHSTLCQPALELLNAVKSFMNDVVAGREPVKGRMSRRGEENVQYVQLGGRFALRCPERLVLEARQLNQ
ncbi:beta-lactamase-like protein [Favolaschia claudopus]|uniref:Beta-lactamase-like protein n=1 Tax=Favolaschia claudopus TaxID=2862362 RepID=A0AAW0C2Z5_9AGAR